MQDGLVKHTIFGIPGTHLIWLYFANPVTPIVMTFQRVFYNVTDAHSTVAPYGPIKVMATYGIHWYVASDLIVLAVSLVMLFGAMIVFGRLEGNFAEEL